MEAKSVLDAQQKCKKLGVKLPVSKSCGWFYCSRSLRYVCFGSIAHCFGAIE